MKSDPAPPRAVVLPADREQAAVESFVDLFSHLTDPGLDERIDAVYSPRVYFNDTLKEVSGVDSLRHYLRQSAAAVRSSRVELEDVARSGDNYYLRWSMEVRFRRFKKGQPCRSLGVSHLRFEENGKIIHHRDYWDSTVGLFEHIPVLGWVLRRIKRRL